MAQQQAYGDVFLVQTPTLDHWANQLYQEQRIRQVKQQQEDAALDANIQKELGKVRSVDTPEVIKAYDDYKKGKKQLLFNKELQKDPLTFNQAQQKVLQDYQRVFTTANKSAELKDMAKQLIGIKSSDRADDYGQRVNALMNTPISQLSNHPVYGDELLNLDKYRYGGPNTNFAEILQKGIGQPRQVYSKEEPLDKGLQTKITPYTYANTPGQVRDYVLGSMALHQAGRDAAYQWDHTPEKEIDETIKAYKALPKDYWEKIGLPGPQDLMPKNPDNKAENLASLMAMKYAISNAPKEGVPQYRENKAAVMAAQEAKERRMEAMRHANARELVRYRKEIDPNDTEMNNTWIDNYIDRSVSEAKSNDANLMQVYTPHTQTFAHELKGDVVLSKALIRNGNEPDKIFVTKDGKVWPIFYKYTTEVDRAGNPIKGTSVVMKNEKGHPVVDEGLSQPMTKDQTKLALGYKGQTKKELGKTMSSGAKNNSTKSTPKHIDPLGLF